jgi:hypothetical protein
MKPLDDVKVFSKALENAATPPRADDMQENVHATQYYA